MKNPNFLLYTKRKISRLNMKEIMPDLSKTMLNIICYGDSNTFGYLLKAAETYPAQLKEILEYKSAVVLNKGVNGDTIKGLISRADRDVLSNKHANALNVVLLQIGTNDTDFINDGNALFFEYNKLMDILIEYGFEIWAITVPPRSDDPNRNTTIQTLNCLIKQTSKPRKVIDLWEMLADQTNPNNCKSGYLASDRLHLTAKACTALAHKIAEELYKEYPVLKH